jgi:hypothetical protein
MIPPATARSIPLMGLNNNAISGEKNGQWKVRRMSHDQNNVTAVPKGIQAFPLYGAKIGPLEENTFDCVKR